MEDEPRSKAKSRHMGRHKRPLEQAGEDSDDEDEEGGQSSRRALKKAKVGLPLPDTHSKKANWSLGLKQNSLNADGGFVGKPQWRRGATGSTTRSSWCH